MKAHTVWLAGIVAVSACGGRAPVQIDPNARAATPRWNATLQTPADLAGAVQVQGSGWMAASETDSARTQAHVDISNAAPGGRHPWHVHRGRCGNDLGILGPAAAYQPLDVGSDGRAASTASLDIPAPTSGEYFINVHASQNNMATIVACGNLAPPAR
jgi:hypothetical protein